MQQWLVRKKETRLGAVLKKDNAGLGAKVKQRERERER